VISVAIGCEAGCEGKAGLAACDEIENARTSDCTEDLRDDVGQQFGWSESFADDQTNRDCGVEMAAGDMADGKGHG